MGQQYFYKGIFMESYNRKELAEMFSIGVETLRYYENIELITIPKRDKNGYRKYSEESLTEINFITKLKKFGFSLKEISKLLKLIKNEKNLSKENMKKILTEKIAEIDGKIEKMNELKIMLTNLKESNFLGECDTLKLLLKN
jgi:DNA-binding transcriptional MerR regulator